MPIHKLPSLDALETFRAFARNENFTRTAEDLHISQPAVFVKIQELSKLLGVVLYQREGRQLRLTAAGLELARQAEEIHGRLLELQATFRDDRPTPVTLAAGQGAYRYLLANPLSRFMRETKNHLHLELLTADREQCFEYLSKGRAQLAVTNLPMPIEEGSASKASNAAMKIELLSQVHSVVVFPNSHKFRGRKTLDLGDLAEECLILPPKGRPQRQQIEDAFGALGLYPKVRVETTGWDLMMKFTLLGLGLTIVNSLCELPKGLSSRVLEGLPDTRYCLMYRQGFLNKGGELLRQYLNHVGHIEGASAK